MINWWAALRDGLVLALWVSAAALGMFWYNPWLLLNSGDMPRDVNAAAGPKTDEEKRLSTGSSFPSQRLSLRAPSFPRGLLPGLGSLPS